jgi:hypothetical protein
VANIKRPDKANGHQFMNVRLDKADYDVLWNAIATAARAEDRTKTAVFKRAKYGGLLVVWNKVNIKLGSPY